MTTQTTPWVVPLAPCPAALQQGKDSSCADPLGGQNSEVGRRVQALPFALETSSTSFT